jgi:hypothetical protein
MTSMRSPQAVVTTAVPRLLLCRSRGVKHEADCGAHSAYQLRTGPVSTWINPFQ